MQVGLCDHTSYTFFSIAGGGIFVVITAAHRTNMKCAASSLLICFSVTIPTGYIL